MRTTRNYWKLLLGNETVLVGNKQQIATLSNNWNQAKRIKTDYESGGRMFESCRLACRILFVYKRQLSENWPRKSEYRPAWKDVAG